MNKRLKLLSYITILLTISTKTSYSDIGYRQNKTEITDNYTNFNILSTKGSNGVRIGNANITNIGTINGYYSRSVYGSYGVSGLGTLGSIINTGIIKATPIGDTERAVAIRNSAQNSIIKSINNFGSIGGVGKGIAIYNSGVESSSIGDINNTGVMAGKDFNGQTLADGIYNMSNNTSRGDAIASIGNITNSGIISGSEEDNPMAGNGIFNESFSYYDNSKASIGNITNAGVISGKNTHPRYLSNSGNGIFNGTRANDWSDLKVSISSIGNITNSGIISGYAPSTDNISSGNGIYNEGTSADSQKGDGNIQDIKNSGVISGYSQRESMNDGSGNGIFNNGYGNAKIKSIQNDGVIKGTHTAISGTYDSIKSNGILAGKRVATGFYRGSNGVDIFLGADNSIKTIRNGIGGLTASGKTIVNADIDGTISTVNGVLSGTDSYINASNLKSNTNLIINGAGVNKGALVINKEINISDSIINGYNSAIYLEGSNKLNATNVIFNGGGLENNTAVIKGDSLNNKINLSQSSVINGDVDLGDGNDNMSLDNTVQINGNLNGGAGESDLLNLGIKSNNENLKILNNISGFEQINSNGNITLFETAKITGASNIDLQSGNTILRIDPTQLDAEGKIIGHALYENKGTINSTGGKLIMGLNGLGADTIVSMGQTTIHQNVNDHWWKDSDYLTTNSLVLDGKLSENGKDVHITIKELIDILPPVKPPVVDPPAVVDPPKPPVVDPPTVVNPPKPEPPTIINQKLYVKLNEVYKSIASSGEIGKLANTTLIDSFPGDSYLEPVEGEIGKSYEDALGGLLTILDQIYANNPYAYTLKSSRDSLKLFEDNISYLTIKPNAKEWLVQGKGIYTGIKSDNGDSGKNYHGFDTGHRNYKTTTSTAGGLATFEYGLSHKSSLGFVFGGNKQDVSFKGSSSINGNSLYLGTFAKTQKNNFNFMSGLGYQYTSADVNRGISNKYDSFKTNNKYNINSFNIFVESKYILPLDQGYRLEPKVRLSYYNINQDSINEGYDPDNLSIKVNSQNANTFDIEFGADLIREIPTNLGKLNSILSFGVIRTLGDVEKDLHGNVLGATKNGSTFDIKGAQIPEVSGKIGYNLELEQINGMIYTTGANLEFAQDGNRNYTLQIGLGYKF